MHRMHALSQCEFGIGVSSEGSGRVNGHYVWQLLGRQAKLGISCRVKVPAGKGLTSHSYRVLHMQKEGVK
jgi:hypothetical protein